MKVRIVFIFLILTFILSHPVFSQEKYDWLNIEKITMYDLRYSGFGCAVDLIDDIPLTAKPISSTLGQWLPIFQNFHTEHQARDVANEPCVIVLIEYKNGFIIPFEYFPEQRVFLDLRKNHFNYFFIKSESFGEIDKLFITFDNCAKDPKCTSIR